MFERFRGLVWSAAGLDVLGAVLVAGPVILALAAGVAAYVVAPEPWCYPLSVLALALAGAALWPIYELGTLVVREPDGERISRFLRLVPQGGDEVELVLDDVRGFMAAFGGTEDPLANAHTVADDVRRGFPAAIRHLEAGDRAVRLTATTALVPAWLMTRHRWTEVPIPAWRALLFRWQMSGICAWMRLYTSDGPKSRRLPVRRWERAIVPAGAAFAVHAADAAARGAKPRRHAQAHAHLHANR